MPRDMVFLDGLVFLDVVFSMQSSSMEWSSRQSGLFDLCEFNSSSTIKDMVNIEAQLRGDITIQFIISREFNFSILVICGQLEIPVHLDHCSSRRFYLGICGQKSSSPCGSISARRFHLGIRVIRHPSYQPEIAYTHTGYQGCGLSAGDSIQASGLSGMRVISQRFHLGNGYLSIQNIANWASRTWLAGHPGRGQLGICLRIRRA